MNVNEDAIGEKKAATRGWKMKRMGDDFRRGYADKSGQEREDEARRGEELRVRMEWQDWYGARSAFQGTEGKLVGRRVEHYEKQWNDRPGVARERSFYYRDSLYSFAS